MPAELICIHLPEAVNPFDLHAPASPYLPLHPLTCSCIPLPTPASPYLPLLPLIYSCIHLSTPESQTVDSLASWLLILVPGPLGKGPRVGPCYK